MESCVSCHKETSELYCRECSMSDPGDKERIEELDAEIDEATREHVRFATHLLAAEKRIKELSDELEDVSRDADQSEEELGYLKDMQTAVAALFDVTGIPAHEAMTAAETVECAVEHFEELKDAIRKGPHQMGCHSLQKPNTPGWASLELCDCWKREALEGE